MKINWPRNTPVLYNPNSQEGHDMRILTIVFLCLFAQTVQSSQGEPLLEGFDREDANRLQLVILTTDAGSFEPTQPHVQQPFSGELHPINIFPKDIWVLIATLCLNHRDWSVENHFDTLLTLRLTHPYLMQNIDQLPGFQETFSQRANDHFDSFGFNATLQISVYKEFFERILPNIRSSDLLTRIFRERLRSHAVFLWQMRYCPGMSPSSVEPIVRELGLPISHSPLNALRAMRLGYAHSSGCVGYSMEGFKAVSLCGLSAASLYFTWASSYRVSDYCKTIYYLPADILWVDTLYRTLHYKLGLTAFAGVPLIVYSITALLPCCLDRYAYDWGHRNYLNLEIDIEHRAECWQGSCKKALRILSASGLSLAVVGIAIGAYYLLADTYAIPIQQLTVADYYNANFWHNLHADAHCCALRIGQLTAAACPDLTYLSGNMGSESAILATAEYIVPYGQIALAILPMAFTIVNTLFWYFL